MIKTISVNIITVALAVGVFASISGSWRWQCVDCSAGGQGYGSRNAANEAGKNHERDTKGHRWDLYED